MYKTATWVHYCKTNPAYFEAWENGYGPGKSGEKPTSEQRRKAKLQARKKHRPPRARDVQVRTPPVKAKTRKLLGDHVASALEKVGITKERVTSFLGKPCPCAKRQRKLNQLDAWARKILTGEVIDIEAHNATLSKIIEENEQQTTS
jgi:hypothetical protein